MVKLDKRLQARRVRDGRLSEAAVREERERLPDLAEMVRRLDETDLEAFRSDLETEGVVRASSIERALERAVAPPPPPPQPVQGFDEEDL